MEVVIRVGSHWGPQFGGQDQESRELENWWEEEESEEAAGEPEEPSEGDVPPSSSSRVHHQQHHHNHQPAQQQHPSGRALDTQGQPGAHTHPKM